MTGSLTRRPGLMAVALLLACGDDLGPRVPAAILLTPATPRVFVGETLQLDATVVDASGQEISGQEITFRSSDATVLTVDDAGLLTSAGSTGGSVITAASGDITTEVEAEVVLPPSAVVANPRTLDLDTGEQVALFFTVTGVDGEPIPGAEVTVETSDPAIARVETVDWSDALVFVTGLDIGNATVTLTSGGRTAQVPVTVARYPGFAVVTPASLLFPSASGSQQVTAALVDRTGEEMDPPEPFAWSSSDETVAVVGTDGMVTAIGLGSAIITATTDTFTATLGVFVGTPPAGEMVARVPFVGATGVAALPDGRYFASGLGLFASGALPDFGFPTELNISGPSPDLTVTADGTRAYVLRTFSGTFGPGAYVVDLTTNSPLDFVTVHSGIPSAAAVSADGSMLIVGTSDGFEAIRLPVKVTIGATAVGPITKVTHDPSRGVFYASGSDGVFEIDDGTAEVLRRFRAPASAHAVSPDGTQLYAVNFGGGIRVWDLQTGEEKPRLGAVAGTEIAVSPDGRFLYVIFGSNHIVGGSRLYILDRASGALLRTVVLGGLALRIAMTGDGVAVITNEGEPDAWVDFVR